MVFTLKIEGSAQQRTLVVRPPSKPEFAAHRASHRAFATKGYGDTFAGWRGPSE